MSEQPVHGRALAGRRARRLAMFNGIRLAMLIAAFVAAVVLLGAAVGALVGAFWVPHMVSSERAVSWGFVGTAGGTLVAFGWGLAAWFRGDRLILAMTGARELTPQADADAFEILDRLAGAAGIVRPRLYLIEDDALNAYAIGRNPRHASVAITSGLRERLGANQLASVLGHEIAHIRHRDTHFGTLLTATFGLLVIVWDRAWTVLWRHQPRYSRDGEARKRNRLGRLFALAVLLGLCVPGVLLTHVLQFVMGRRREYEADAAALELSGSPEALASSLSIMTTENVPMRRFGRAVAHLFIMNPLGQSRPWHDVDSVFRSHPSVKHRIDRILAERP